ncbi:BQ5605_C035g11452 [Microbotryum silenes-dioicae]|uniref:BQ5605_C035g11452 protein n=1 Tax=Microbotryum silenes-dioicae TaxID=796604 RepID=A0A2X0PGU9_9BASI|nr:BQ5605_C035g11452 [Microbotryum silenes-dioicae]
MRRSIELPDEALGNILDLVESTESSPHPGKNDQVFYVQSWRLRIEELARVVGALGLAISPAWSKLVDQEDSPSKFSFDNKKRTTSMLGAFLMALRVEVPDAYNNAAKAFKVRNARLAELATRDERDLGERVLVSFFGREQLLHVQWGGHYGQYDPEWQVFEFNETHHSGYFALFETHVGGCGGAGACPLRPASPRLLPPSPRQSSSFPVPPHWPILSTRHRSASSRQT